MKPMRIDAEAFEYLLKRRDDADMIDDTDMILDLLGRATLPDKIEAELEEQRRYSKRMEDKYHLAVEELAAYKDIARYALLTLELIHKEAMRKEDYET